MRPYYECLFGTGIFLLLNLYDGKAMPFQRVTSLPQTGSSRTGKDSLAARWLKDCINEREKGDYTASLDAGLKAVKAYQQSGDTSKVALSFIAISQIYQFLGEQKSSTSYITRGIEYAKTGFETYAAAKDTAGEMIGMNTIGILYRSMALVGRPSYYDSALACYRDALSRISPSGKGREYTGTLYNNISQVYSEYKKDYPTALRYLQQAVEFNKLNNNREKLSFNYGNIANVYRLMGDKRSSLEYAYKTLSVAREITTANRLLNAYQQLYDSYRSFGMADSALHYYVLYDNMRDSISSLATTRQIAEMQAKYETEKNKSIIGVLNNKNSIQNKKIIMLVSGISLLLLFLLGLFLLYGRVQRQKQLITGQTRQLEIMMKELHHRVKNNLQIVSSLLSLQSYKLQDEEALEAIRLSQQRVQAMSFIHQRLYSGDQSRMVDMEEYLLDLSKSLVMAYGYTDQAFDLQVSVTKKWLDVDKALPMGLIANEIITNALKYAYTNIKHPSLHIELKEYKDNVLLVLKDNGNGWDEKEWQQSGKKSFGRQLVASLCQQLNATEELAIGNGAAFIFTIPLEGAA